MAHTLHCDDIWTAIEHASFAVLAHTSASGEPRSSGVVYAVVDRHLFVTVAPDSWKARQIEDGGLVSMTVTVRRGGLLSLLFPIPPATISFRARAIVHAATRADRRTCRRRCAGSSRRNGGRARRCWSSCPRAGS